MKFIVFQHLAVEHPGVLRDYMRDEGVDWETIALDEGAAIPDLSPYDAMLVMGGPQDVWQEREHPWLITEKAAIRRFVIDMKRPYLGICLGHQLLASALGGDVALASVPEVGVTTITKCEAALHEPMFTGIADVEAVLQWHGAEVTRLPPGAVALAQSGACAIQAFRAGNCAYGIQYHVEATASTVDDWGAIPAYARALDSVMGDGAVGRLRADVADRLPQFNAHALKLYQNFKAVIAANATSKWRVMRRARTADACAAASDRRMAFARPWL